MIHTSLTLIVFGRNCYSGWHSAIGAARLGSGKWDGLFQSISLLPVGNLHIFFCDFYILIYIEGLRASLKVINSPTLGLINIKQCFNAHLSRLFMKC